MTIKFHYLIILLFAASITTFIVVYLSINYNKYFKYKKIIAHRRYKKALADFQKKPMDKKLKSICFITGDTFYKFEIPDNPIYPDEYGDHSDDVIKSKTRKKCIEKDIKDVMKSLKR
jgi:hypothetical protein